MLLNKIGEGMILRAFLVRTAWAEFRFVLNFCISHQQRQKAANPDENRHYQK